MSSSHTKPPFGIENKVMKERNFKFELKTKGKERKNFFLSKWNI